MDNIEVSILMSIIKRKFICGPCCQAKGDISFFNDSACIIVDYESAIETILATCKSCGYIMQFDVEMLKKIKD
jgi:transcription elongation factor Elf1